MTRERFRQLVSEAIDTIPLRFRRELKNIAIVVEDRPSPDVLEEMEIEPPDTLFGLYQGTPLTERRWDHGNVLPDRIAIYQEPIEEVSETEDEVVTEIGETLIHEVGHYFGLSEEEIEEIEDRYWHDRTGEVDDDEDGAEPDDGGGRER
jgi:predicted Zn-dependent protease with MMP-like domain